MLARFYQIYPHFCTQVLYSCVKKVHETFALIKVEGEKKLQKGSESTLYINLRTKLASEKSFDEYTHVRVTRSQHALNNLDHQLQSLF